MDYWIKRNLETQERLSNKSIAQTNRQLRKYYKAAMERVIGDFEKTYDKIMAAAKDGKEVTPADLYKLDVYWTTQNRLREELQKLGDKQAALMSKEFTTTYQSIYNSLAIPSEDFFTQIDKQAANQMINRIWCADGKSWSKRVWENTDKLQQALNDELLHCLITGKKTSDLKKRLQREFGVSYKRADTLARTEIAHIQTEAARERYINYGLQEVEVLADYDERRCDICGKLHKKRFPIGGKMPVPAHPNCRCCIVPVID